LKVLLYSVILFYQENKRIRYIYNNIEKKIKHNSALVIEKYECPTVKYPFGRLIIVAGNKLVHIGELPYLNATNLERGFPFIRQCSIVNPGCFWGTSVIERCIPIQRSFNAIKNRKHEFLNRLSMGVLAVEDGSVDTDNLEEEGIAKVACKKLGVLDKQPDMSEWLAMLEKERNMDKKIQIALVGKYVELHDAYLSIVESLHHGGIATGADVEINWINAEYLTEQNIANMLSKCHGILVPGGFGDRGLEGKIRAIQYARENNIPFFGICLGMQCAVIEFARNVLGWKDAFTAEVRETTHAVIDLMPEQKDIDNLGGTMRLGAYPCKLDKSSRSYKAYDTELIYERHRHRYEFNNEYRKQFVEAGMQIVGLSPDDRLVEIVEIPQNDWFVGVQFHPEFKSRPNRCQPLFRDFVQACINYSEKETK